MPIANHVEVLSRLALQFIEVGFHFSLALLPRFLFP